MLKMFTTVPQYYFFLKKWRFRVLVVGNILKEFHISAYIQVIYLKSKIYRTLKKYLSFKKNGPFLWNQNICINFCFWYCSLLFICVCACTRLWAQTNSANSFKKYVYVENVDNFTLVLIFIEKAVIQSSHGSTRGCLIPRINFVGLNNVAFEKRFSLKQVWLSFIFVGNSSYMILQKVCCGILFFRLVIIGDSLTIMCYLAINEFLYSFSCSLIKLVTQPPPSHMSIGYNMILIPLVFR